MNIQITDEQLKELVENEVKNTVEKEVKNAVKAWFSKEANNIQPIVTQEVRLYLYRQNLDIPKMISEMQTEVLAEKITSHIGESIADYFREKYYYD